MQRQKRPRKTPKNEEVEAIEERIEEVLEERRRVDKLYDELDLSGTEEAPECFHFGDKVGKDYATDLSGEPEHFKFGFASWTPQSRLQALCLQLSGWTRHPRAGSTMRCSMGGESLAWWADVFYRRAGRSVLVLPVLYAMCFEHDKPNLTKKPNYGANAGAARTVESVTAVLKKSLHKDAHIDDIRNIDLAAGMTSMLYDKKPTDGLYVIRKPNKILWALTDPSLVHPLVAYANYDGGKPH